MDVVFDARLPVAAPNAVGAGLVAEVGESGEPAPAGLGPAPLGLPASRGLLATVSEAPEEVGPALSEVERLLDGPRFLELEPPFLDPEDDCSEEALVDAPATQQPFLEPEGDASREAHVDAPVPPLVDAAMSSGEGVVPGWSGGFARIAGSATALAPSEASPSAPRGGGARFAH